MLKERRALVVMPREKPFNRIHLKNMLELTDAGAIVMPPFPSFYQGPKSIDEMITRTVARALTQLDVEVEYEEWAGLTS
jgi:4-hydroxy-3-polyprenylbenzoate decarboxylase